MGAVGIFGGTFDPVHYGHLRSALELREVFGLDQIRLIPGGDPPHRTRPGATPEQRLAMLRLAVQAEPGLVVDDREVRRTGPSYSVDTLRSIRREIGEGTPLLLFLGVDAFLGLGAWHCWEAIPELAHIVVTHRPGWHLGAETGVPESAARALLARRQAGDPSVLKRAAAGAVWTQPVTQLAISATAIRELVAAGRSPRFLLPDAVLDYIHSEGLYRGGV